MKRISKFFGLFAVLFAITAAFAFTPTTSAKTNDPMYHWFDASGNYLGQFTLSSQQGVCPGGETTICERGYTDVTIDENSNVIPVGSPLELYKP